MSNALRGAGGRSLMSSGRPPGVSESPSWADVCPSCGEQAEQNRDGDWQCRNRSCHLDTYNPRNGKQVFSW